MRSARAPLASVFLVLAAGSGAGCGERPSDTIAYPDASLGGSGDRLASVNDPGSPARPGNFPATPWTVSLTGLVVNAIDAFDETKDGKSVGTAYLQDVGAAKPFSGIGTFGLTFQPAGYKAAPGDVIDATGTYQENASIGSTVTFPAGTFLPQLYRPTATARFEGQPSEPIDIAVDDLRTFATGRPWIGMLVRVKDVSLPDGLKNDGKGRITGALVTGTDRNLPTVSNELFDLRIDDYAANTKFESITGIVTFFYSLHIAPRRASDLRPASAAQP